MQKCFSCANPQFHQLSGWLVSDDPAGEEAGCGGPGLAWLHVVCSCEAGVAKFSITTEAANGREINVNFSGNISGRHSCRQHANCTLPKNVRRVALCCVIKLHILQWPFIVANTRCTCAQPEEDWAPLRAWFLSRFFLKFPPF